jgi:hypothetical protein
MSTPSRHTLTQLHVLLDDVVTRDYSQLSPNELGTELSEISRAEARLAAARLALLATAQLTGVAQHLGSPSTGAWAAPLMRTDTATSHRYVGLATKVATKQTTQKSLALGSITPKHAAVIVKADQQLPSGTTPAQRQLVESQLVSKAHTLNPSQLQRVARRALATVETDDEAVDAHENELVYQGEQAAWRQTRIDLREHNNTITGQFTVPSRYGHILRKLLRAMTTPQRAKVGASRAHTGPVKDYAQARGHAFCELIEHLPTQQLQPQSAVTLVVTTSLEVLTEKLRVAEIDTGGVTDAGEVRRLACTAGVVAAVFGGQSQVLDYGRAKRMFTDAQRTTLSLTYRHCQALGCERAFAWCELHHVTPWAQGGTTDLRNAIPLCHFHHQRIHDHHYQHTLAADGRIRFVIRR